MDIKNNSFSLRDYIAYLFPGTLLIAAYVINNNEIMALMKNEKLVTSVIILVGGYFLGYASNILALRTITKIIDDIYDDPFKTILSNPKENSFNEKFANILNEELKKYWGEEIIECGESNLFFLCWREVQTLSHAGIQYQLRLVSLWNFCTSTLIPSFILGLVLIAQDEIFLSLTSFIIMYLMISSRVALRQEFARNVYRIWYVSLKNKSIASVNG